jgi:putative transposase
MVSPARRRDAVAFLVRRHKVSERRACQVVGQNRSTQRYAPIVPEEELRLVAAMNKLATKHPRWGYRRIHRLLRDDGWRVNIKRVERLWRLEGHRVPPRRTKASGQKALGREENSIWMRPASAANHIWAYDLMSTRTRRGHLIRILNVVDEFTRVALGVRVKGSIGAVDVRDFLDQLFEQHGVPRGIRSDNGREFVATTVTGWLTERGVEPIFVEKASPQQNSFIERFNGSMRDEVLYGEEFDTVLEARVVIEQWLEVYNNQRPHRGLGMLTPQAFAMAQNEVLE